MTTLILLGIIIAIGLLVVLVLIVVKKSPDTHELARLQTREQDFLDARKTLEEKEEIIESLREEKSKLEARLENEKRNAEGKLKLLQNAEERLKTDFENLANRIFEEKGAVLTDRNRERMEGLLQPFKEQLESFRKRADDIHRSETEQSSRLMEQVRQLQQLSNKVSEDANNLADAIKGESKKQGDWGEVIIERIFEESGLEEGREYERQSGIRDGSGELKRPDFIVNLPGGKSVIVDSKVSLTAYERFYGTNDETERKKKLKKHVASVRKHVDELASKDYSSLLGDRTLDFVLMCIPLESAYHAAMEADRNLIYDLGKSNVVITGPTTLMITIRLIAQIWRRERENKNAAIIAEQAGRMYDQVALIVEAMEEAKKRMGLVSDSFEKAMKRIKEGKGNLVGRIEKLRKLGAKVNKQIPTETMDTALQAEEDEEDDEDELEGNMEESEDQKKTVTDETDKGD